MNRPFWSALLALSFATALVGCGCKNYEVKLVPTGESLKVDPVQVYVYFATKDTVSLYSGKKSSELFEDDKIVEQMEGKMLEKTLVGGDSVTVKARNLPHPVEKILLWGQFGSEDAPPLSIDTRRVRSSGLGSTCMVEVNVGDSSFGSWK